MLKDRQHIYIDVTMLSLARRCHLYLGLDIAAIMKCLLYLSECAWLSQVSLHAETVSSQSCEWLVCCCSVQGYGLKSEMHQEAGWVYPGSGGTHDSRQNSLAPGISLPSEDGPGMVGIRLQPDICLYELIAC